MADIIQLLPDAIANQIAAGEVVQRPASVVKELLENAIDAGASNIKLILKEAGKSMIQVVDNGCGMSETDARLCFERHATSKIREAADLFAIRTMGFRGEALASIAAVAQVELKSRLHDQEIGTRIAIEGSEVRTQEPCQCTAGTTLLVRNLFYNVPARRQFLKSDSAEMRHILDEFTRIAIANPEIYFSVHHNGNELYHLPPGNLRQRIVGIMGNTMNKKLVPVQEETDILKIYGFVGKPEAAKKTRGDQYFFVNQRFIKSSYLNHAVSSAYDELLPKDTYPFYAIFLDIHPSRIDVNVHPTKQEIKFEDERIVYNYLKVGVRHALGRHLLTPTLDFEQEAGFTQAAMTGVLPAFDSRTHTPQARSTQQDASNLANWQKLFEGIAKPIEEEEIEEGSAVTIESALSGQSEMEDQQGHFNKVQRAPYQLHHAYIVSPIKSGFLLIDQQAAHERILYEEFLSVFETTQPVVQKQLFPRTIELSAADADILRNILGDTLMLGFDIAEFGQNTFIVHGIPADLPAGADEQAIVENLLEQFKNNLELRLSTRDNLARALARSGSIKRGQSLDGTAMQELIDKLFACAMPYKSPSGRHCFITFTLEEIEKRLVNH